MSADAAAFEAVHVSCPRCASDDAARRLRLAASWIVSCRRCGMSYVDPRAPSERLQRRLQEWAREDVVDEERLRIAFDEGNLEHYGRLVRLLERHRPPGAARRMLDVGCSTGAYLTVARAAGWDARGVEVGTASSAYARDRLGLAVRQGSLYDLAPADGPVDAVAMLEVIEHLERPAEALARVRALLAPDGLLLLTTPNFDSLYRRLYGSRWWVVNCEEEHIVLFTRESLTGILREQGFEPLEVRIRGLDVVGLLREMRRSVRGGQDAPRGAAPAGPESYYAARSAHARIKSTLRRIGVLRAAKALLRGLDRTFAWRASPTHAWGEQLIVVAARR